MKAVKPGSAESACYRIVQVGKALAQQRPFAAALATVYGDRIEPARALVALGRDMLALADALP
jgi:hypothetical protein